MNAIALFEAACIEIDRDFAILSEQARNQLKRLVDQTIGGFYADLLQNELKPTIMQAKESPVVRDGKPRPANQHIADLESEVILLRNALLPFARLALTREAKDELDYVRVNVPLAYCRAAQKALAAD